VDCFNRAYICACSAVGADLGIDLVNISFGNSLNGTLIDAGSASGAIFIYFVSHDFVILCLNRSDKVNNAILSAKIKNFYGTSKHPINFISCILHLAS